MSHSHGGSDSTSGLWQREWHREKEEGVCVCVRGRSKERGNREFLSQDEEKEGKSWTIKKGKGHRKKELAESCFCLLSHPSTVFSSSLRSQEGEERRREREKERASGASLAL